MKKLTTTQAGEKLNVNDSRVRQLIKAKMIAAEKIGSMWLIDPKEIDQYKKEKEQKKRGKTQIQLEIPA